MAIEEPRFTVITEEKPFEIRVYEPMIIAEVQVSGDRDSATNQGFRLIADFIFGNNEGTNQASQKIAMTAPVTIEKQTQAKLPVSSTQEELADGVWRIQFVMPSEYTLANLPKPTMLAYDFLHGRVGIGQDASPIAIQRSAKPVTEAGHGGAYRHTSPGCGFSHHHRHACLAPSKTQESHGFDRWSAA